MHLNNFKNYFYEVVKSKNYGYVWTNSEGEIANCEEEQHLLRISISFLLQHCDTFNYNKLDDTFIAFEDQDGDVFLAPLYDDRGDTQFCVQDINELESVYERVMDYIDIRKKMIKSFEDMIYRKDLDDPYKLRKIISE